MATSGSCDTSKYGSVRWLRFSWSRSNYVSTESECYSDIYYEIRGVRNGGSGFYMTGPVKLWINRSSGNPDKTFASDRIELYDKTLVGSGTFRIHHNKATGNGSFSVYIEAAIYTFAINCYGSGSWTLDRLTRPISVSNSQRSKSSSSISINWSSSTPRDWTQYSLNGGSWTDASDTVASDNKSGYYTLSGLSANSTYTVRTRCRRSGGVDWGYSDTLTITTHAKTVPSISLSGRTSTSLTVTSSCNVTASSTRYRIAKAGGSYGSWQTSATFSGLSSNTTYTIQVEKIGSASGEAGYASINATTHYTTVATVGIGSRTSSSLTATSNCNVSVSSTRYRIAKSGGSWGAWQSSATFSGLAANTTYTIQVEKVASASGEAGYASVNGTTHQKTIPTISLASKTSSSITVSSGCNVTVSSTQYRIRTSNGSYGNYQSGATFSGLSANTTYVVEVKKVGKDSGEAATATVTVTTHQKTIPTISLSSRTIKSITVSSGCNVTASSTRYRIKTTAATSYGAWQTSNVFNGLAYNTSYDIQVEKVGQASGEAGYATISRVYTLDIARITSYNKNWNVEDSTAFDITNVGNCVMRLYLLYNNIEIIYRNGISLNNGKYTFELTTAEKNQLYSLAAGETNPDFKFVLRSYYESALVGSDSAKAVSIEFPTKAWTKVDGIWKRALVWGRPNINSPWRQSLPWVEIADVWKRV